MATGQFESYELFVKRSLVTLLGVGGFFGFIVPDRLLPPAGERLRRFLFDNYQVLAVVKAGEGVFRASVILIVRKAEPGLEDSYVGLVHLGELGLRRSA